MRGSSSNADTDRTVLGCATVVGIGLVMIGVAAVGGGWGLIADGVALVLFCGWRWRPQ